MVDERPPNWDWVKATHECSAQVMFGELKALARRDIARRNEQLGREVVRFTEINGIQFSVSKDAGIADRVYFKVTDDLARVSVKTGGNPEELYTVGLDDSGMCKLRRDGKELDPWQALKAALEPLLFG